MSVTVGAIFLGTFTCGIFLKLGEGVGDFVIHVVKKYHTIAMMKRAKKYIDEHPGSMFNDQN